MAQIARLRPSVPHCTSHDNFVNCVDTDVALLGSRAGRPDLRSRGLIGQSFPRPVSASRKKKYVQRRISPAANTLIYVGGASSFAAADTTPHVSACRHRPQQILF